MLQSPLDVSVTSTVGDFQKLVGQAVIPSYAQNSIGICSRQHQSRLHAGPGFIPADRSRPHFHTPDDLLGAIIRPGDGWIVVESTEAWPGLAQPDEQIP